jgi:hypothetical protein
MILCGWCGKATANHERCTSCGHVLPEVPWTQRGQDPPTVAHEPGRPATDPGDVGRRLAAAHASLGPHATVDAVAELLDVSPRTVRRWQKMAG